jgi:hypothetical protein
LKSGYQVVAGHSETDSTEAYDNFLKGWEYYQNDNEKDLIKAPPHFQRAVASLSEGSA